MSDGIQNEINFKNYFDRKKVKELSKNAQELIISMFGNISLESKIDCWRSKYLEKADIKIKINGEIKGVSIKSGHQCSMHQEPKERFYKFLNDKGLNKEIIKILDKYIIGKIEGQKVDSFNYILNNKEEISKLKEGLNNYYIKNQLFLRFIFQGIELQKYDCSAIIHGNPNEFLWATNTEIIKYLLNYENYQSNYVNIGPLNIKCYDRNLQNNPERISKENYIQIKWYNLEEDLLYLTKIREAAKIRKNNLSKNNTF